MIFLPQPKGNATRLANVILNVLNSVYTEGAKWCFISCLLTQFLKSIFFLSVEDRLLGSQLLSTVKDSPLIPQVTLYLFIGYMKLLT